MKPQDLVFLGILLVLILLRKPKVLVTTGLASFLISAPLFALQVFFTAQRLVIYGAGFIFVAILFMLYDLRREK